MKETRKQSRTFWIAFAASSHYIESRIQLRTFWIGFGC